MIIIGLFKHEKKQQHQQRKETNKIKRICQTLCLGQSASVNVSLIVLLCAP